MRSRKLALAPALLALIALAAPPAAPAHRITKPRWLRGVTITEYFPVPERWFDGARVRARGVRGRHRVDWLYGGSGLSMEGHGVGLNGRRYHIFGLGRQGWVDRNGRRTRPRGLGGWTRGFPFWRAVGWRNRKGQVTYPLERGGWYRGKPRRYIPPRGISFARGWPLPLRYWRSLAVDPRLIPLGSRVYVPAYRHKPGGGWFRAQDTGGAITGRHIDVYRPAPPRPGGGTHLTRRRIYVIPPRRH